MRRIAFVSKNKSYRFAFGKDLDGLYTVKEFRVESSLDCRKLLDFRPDITFFFQPELQLDDQLSALSGKRVALSSEELPKRILGRLNTSAEMDSRLDALISVRDRYDFLFQSDFASIRALIEKGADVTGEFLLPVATGIHREIQCEKTWDWISWGHANEYCNTFLGEAERMFAGHRVAQETTEGEFVDLANRSRIGINVHVDPHLSSEPTIQRMMACGLMVLSEPLSHNRLFVPGQHYEEFSTPWELLEKLGYYLSHEDERKAVASRGMTLVKEQLDAKGCFERTIDFLSSSDAAQRGFLFCNYQVTASPVTKRTVSIARLEKAISLRSETPAGRRIIRRVFPSGSIRHRAYRGLVAGIKRLSPLGLPLYDALKRLLFAHSSKASRGPVGARADTKESLGEFLARAASDNSLTPSAPTVAVVLPSQWISGGTMVLCEHARRLIQRGYNVVLLDDLDAQTPVSISDWFPGLLSPVRKVEGLRLDKIVDTVVASHWSTAYTAMDFPARRRLYFVQSDESRFHAPGSPQQKLAEQTYRMDFDFVTIARWLQHWLKQSFDKESSYVSNGVRGDLFYPGEPFEPRTRRMRVLLEGPIDVAFKGLADAFAAVDDIDCEVWCVSSRGRPRKEWHCDKFFFQVPFSQMRQIYASCDVLLKMSRVEGFFMPPLEMMACGGTVVTGKVTGYDEYIVDGYNGLVVEPGDVPGAAKCLRRLSADRGLLQRLQANGVETASQWSWERGADAFAKILGTL